MATRPFTQDVPFCLSLIYVSVLLLQSVTTVDIFMQGQPSYSGPGTPSSFPPMRFPLSITLWLRLSVVCDNLKLSG